MSADPGIVEAADRLILPGVGAFDHAMRCLRAGPLLPILTRRVLVDGVPILGLCLGAQLIGRSSEEGQEDGLGWVNASTVRFNQSRVVGKLPIPHMGWTDVKRVQRHPLLETEEPEQRFYFAHSYHLQCDDTSLVLGTAVHGYEFPAAIAKNNIMGVQFHPEKSHVFGMRLLKNFVENSLLDATV